METPWFLKKNWDVYNINKKKNTDAQHRIQLFAKGATIICNIRHTVMFISGGEQLPSLLVIN